MSNFERYARYYDLLYREKDYASEAAFVGSLLAAHVGRSAPLRILDLGSGTGRHARLLAAAGHRVHGVDLSADMVAKARLELSGDPAEVRARVTFGEGDVRHVRLDERFDAAVSLFHVMSYQTSQADLEAALATARAHLVEGGVLLFDAWYGPGVLADPPSVRVKRVQGPEFSVLRLSEPTLEPNDDRVDVSYTLFVSTPAGEVIDVTRETHRMRYWFNPEITVAASRAGFDVAELGEWMTRATPGPATWNAYWVLRARA